MVVCLEGRRCGGSLEEVDYYEWPLRFNSQVLLPVSSLLHDCKYNMLFGSCFLYHNRLYLLKLYAKKKPFVYYIASCEVVGHSN